MIYRHVYKLENNKIVIQLPESFRNSRNVIVIVEDVGEDRAHKMRLMKGAANDVLFRKDIEEINEDFKSIDPESLEE